MVAYRLVELLGRAECGQYPRRQCQRTRKTCPGVRAFSDSPSFVTLGRNHLGTRTDRGEPEAMTPEVIEAVVAKVEEQRITNSKDLRKLRTILRDPVARDHFLTEEGDIDSAMLRLGPGL